MRDFVARDLKVVLETTIGSDRFEGINVPSQYEINHIRKMVGHHPHYRFKHQNNMARSTCSDRIYPRYIRPKAGKRSFGSE